MTARFREATDLADSAELVRLARHRPTSSDADGQWGAARRDRVLDGILSSAHTVPTATARTTRRAAPAARGRRRITALLGVAAAAAVAVSVAPAVLHPTGLPAAGAIDRLAAAASRGQALVIPEGQFLHQVVQDTQQGGGESANGSRTLESWTSADGRTWRRDTANGRVTYHAFDALAGGPIDMSPKGVAALPTDAGDLLDLLGKKVEGSTSVDEAVFVAVGDMTRLGYTPPAVRAAAIQALGRLPEVSASEADGRVTLSYVDESARPGVRQSLVFDAESTRLVAESLTAPELTFTSRTTTSEVVRAVPQEVLTGAASSPAKKATAAATTS